MKYISILIFALLIFNACKHNSSKGETGALKKTEYLQVSNAQYQLAKPGSRPNAVLVLFGGFAEVAEDIQREFKILDSAKAHKIALVFSNYNQKLWLEENEAEQLAKQLLKIVDDNKLPKDNLYLGGFSSGGNVALLVADYLSENAAFGLKPKGVFIVDAPVDLAELYLSAEKNIERGFSEPSIQESTWLMASLGNRFGDPRERLTEYEAHSVFTLKSGNADNIKHLKNTKIRMYTEPDTVWWKANRRADYEQLNAYHIKKLAEQLNRQGFKKVAYMPTENSGYRANGERHPHSWSIVKTDDLIKWMLEE